MLNRLWCFVVAYCFALVFAAHRDPYKLLQVSKKASVRQIKKAFREQSKQWHPDKNKGDLAAEKKFQDIAWAYDILGNETKRRIFDKYGEEGVKRSEQGLPPDQQGFPGGFPGGGFQGGFPFGGQQFFFKTQEGGPHHGGGFPFGGGGGFPFGGGFGGFHPHGQGPPRGERVVAVEWFEDSNIELVTAKIEVEDMNPYWPDVFFFFSSDNEETELAASNLIIVAEELRSFIEFQAIDCRRAAIICRDLRRSDSIYELQLLTSQCLLERPSSRKANRKPAPFLDAAPHLDSVIIMEWIMDSVPRFFQKITTQKQLTKFLRDHASENKPLVVFVAEGDEPDSRFQKLAAENSKRLTFCSIENSAKNVNFQRQFLKSIQDLMPHGLRAPFMIHVADPHLIKNDTVEFLDFRDSDFAVDLSMMKWVSMRRGNQGVYAVAARSMRELTRDSVKSFGTCGPKDSKYCFIYARRGGALHPEESVTLERAIQQQDTDALRLLWIDSDKQRKFMEGFALPPDNPRSALIVYRPKRRKFATFRPEQDYFQPAEINKIIESVIDGSLLLHQGAFIQKLPELS